MKLNIISLVLILMSTYSFSQNSKVDIKGIVVDTSSVPLPATTVVLLDVKDSVMVGFQVTDKNGKFTIPKVKPGKYILKSSFIGYQTWTKLIELSGVIETFDVGTILLREKRNILNQVDVVADQIPIVINKDTIEYSADFFKAPPNSNVEELLKRLPGVEVGKDGSVKAQGEDVTKIFVDGKEFFGDDPKIATKNLPADAVDRVQVIDKLSDMAEFTGIDDGERNKTINLKLKEDRKKGIFGNIEGGYGSDNRYNANLNLNRFNKKMQMSIIGNSNNINSSPFSFGGFPGLSTGMMVIEGGGPGSQGSSEGITTSSSAGLNFNYDFSKKTSLRSSYFLGNTAKVLDKTIDRENYFNGDIFNSFSSENESTDLNNHRYNLNLNHDINDLSDLIFRGNFNYNSNDVSRTRNSTTTNSIQQTENLLDSRYIANGSKIGVDSEITYRKKFEKTGRNMSVRATIDNNKNLTDLYLNNKNEFNLTDPNNILSALLIQDQSEENKQIDLSGKISYTEPLGDRKFLELNYQRQNYNNNYRKDFFDILDSDRVFNTDLSNIFKRDFVYDRGGLNYIYNGNKTVFNAGLNYQNSHLEGVINSTGEVIQKDFNRFLPSAMFKYNFTTSKRLEFRYSTQLKEPSLDQLQPIINNNDPLNTYLGNPNLKAEFNQSGSIHFNYFDQFSNTSIFSSLNGNYIKDKITNARSIDAFLAQTTMPINVDYEQSLRAYVSFGQTFKPIYTRLNIMTSSTLSKSILYLNDVENLANRNNITVGGKLMNTNNDVIDFTLGMRKTFSKTVYSINKEFNQSYLNSTYYTELNFLLGKWVINTSFDYSVYEGAAFSQNQNVPLLNAFISRNILKNDRGQFKIKGYDILNQNQGISRIADINYIQETQYNILTRYFMVSFLYKLTKLGGPKPAFQIIER